MAVPVYSELSNLILDRIQANVATDAPFTAAEILRHFNEAYQTVWEIESGGSKTANSAAAWTTSPSSGTTGVHAGLLTDIEEVLEVWQSATVGSIGDTAGDILLDRRELSEIIWHRAHASGLGTYASSRLYSITRLAAAADAAVQKIQMDVYPGVNAVYYPLRYVPQFTPLDGATLTTPDLTDLGARDAALIAAARMAPLIGRAEFVPGIFLDISQRTQQALDRKASAGQEGKQDRP